MPIDVCLTVDVEFDIDGAFTFPKTHFPLGTQAVDRRCDGRSHGLGFILDTLKQSGLMATFFIELFNVHLFGDAPMAVIAEQIASAGHDLQMHLHPCWRIFRWQDWQQRLGQGAPNDAFAHHSLQEMVDMLTEGQAIFHRLTGTEPLTFRTGSFSVSRNTYRALSRKGFSMASCVGTGFSPPAETELQLYSGVHVFDGVVEVPALTYQLLRWGNRRVLKLLTITGTPWHEIRILLERASRSGTSPVILLTHASEFARKQGSPNQRHFTPNHINQSRLTRLCRYLSSNPDRYRVTTFQASAEAWKNQQPNNPLIKGSLTGLAMRFYENRLQSFCLSKP